MESGFRVLCFVFVVCLFFVFFFFFGGGGGGLQGFGGSVRRGASGTLLRHTLGWTHLGMVSTVGLVLEGSWVLATQSGFRD